MYFPRQNMIRELVPEEEPLDSLAEDAAFLVLFKKHCALPTSTSFTSKDAMLAMYLDAAEQYIDKFCCPFRPRTIRLSLCGTAQPLQGTSLNAVNFYGRAFSAIRLPFGPIPETPEVLFIDDDGDETIFEEITDFYFVGPYANRPEIIFSRSITWPTGCLQPYPYRVTFVSGADKDNSIQKLAIMMLGSYYFRNPDAMGEESPNVGAEFKAVMSSLESQFL